MVWNNKLIITYRNPLIILLYFIEAKIGKKMTGGGKGLELARGGKRYFGHVVSR